MTPIEWAKIPSTRDLNDINSIWRLPDFLFNHENVEVYTGQFRNGAYNGYGVLEKNGKEYKGVFKDGKVNELSG